MTHARPRYLESKRSVDARSRAPRVRDRLLAELPADPEILEAGCGTGVTVPQLLSWDIDAGQYRGIDTDERIVSFARRVRPAALRWAGHDVTTTSATEQSTSESAGADTDFAVADLAVTFETGDALDALESNAGVDLVVAQSFADLVPLPRFVSAIESALRPGGFAYLPLTFDGGTIFQPDHPADEAVERAKERGFTVKNGDGTKADVLEAAGADHAKVVVAATPDDDVNLLVAQLARTNFGVDEVVGRANQPANLEAFRDLDVQSISAGHAVAAAMDNQIERPGITQWMTEADREGDVQEVEVTKRDLDGDTVAELADRLPEGCIVAMVGRDGNHTVPDGDFRLQRGDHLTIIGEDRDSVHEALRQVHPDVTL